MLLSKLEKKKEEERRKKNPNNEESSTHIKGANFDKKVKIVISYKLIELALIENYIESLESIKDLRDQVSVLDKGINQIINQMKPYQKNECKLFSLLLKAILA